MEEITVQEAIELLEPIPADNFLKDAYTDGESKCCVMGHLKRLVSDNPNDYSYRNCNANDDFDNLRNTISKFSYQDSSYLASVNNGLISRYSQPEIKDRVLACLKEVAKAGL